MIRVDVRRKSRAYKYTFYYVKAPYGYVVSDLMASEVFSASFHTLISVIHGAHDAHLPQCLCLIRAGVCVCK